MSEHGQDVIPLSRFRASSLRPRGKRQVDALLSAENPRAAVEALSVPELYFLVRDVGFADSQELVALAAPEQLRGCVDMDSWDRDRFQLDAALPWLATVAECGFEKLGQVWDALDPEFGALLLSRMATIYDHSLGEEAPEEDERPRIRTPDTYLTIILTSERGDDVALAQRIIDDLYRADPVSARHALMSARSELPAELEEYAYRWRAGRMADLGYVEFYEALEVFRPLDPESVTLDEESAGTMPAANDEEAALSAGQLPAPMFEQAVGRGFLARVLGTIADAALASRLEADLLYLVNRVLAAAKVSPGDEEAVRIGTEHATATLALGLEHVSGGDLEKAAVALERISLVRLHRLGYTLTVRLARSAVALAPRARHAGPVTGAVLTALFSSRPFYPLALDESGGDGVRPFESRADLARVADHLADLTVRIALAVGLGAPGPADDSAAATPLDDYIRTAIVRYALAGALTSGPLSAEELGGYCAQLDDAPGSAIAAGTDRALLTLLADAGLRAAPARLARLLEQWGVDLHEQLAALPKQAPPDLRFVEGLLFTSAPE